MNLLFNYIFVQVLGMQEFGLALAASLGSWVYMAVEAQYFLSGRSSFRISLRSVSLKELWPMVKIGFPGAAGNIYQTIRGMLVNISEEIQLFCLERGIDDRRAHLAGLALEEMAGNVVDYGFKADRKRHTVDVRVVHREDEVLLCIKDDCIKFDPDEFVRMTDKGEDLTKNIGLRIVFRIAKEVKYQNVLGLNVLTMKI